MDNQSQLTRIGRYRVVEKLGKGGMGDVYLGYDETLERKVALKCIRAENRLDEEAKARFLREAKVLSQLEHSDICQIYDFIEGEDADFLVLELISGRKLSDVIEENKLSLRQKLLLAKRVVSVLSLAHEKGIVHRDLKPDNVIMAENGEIKVLDFGLARQLLSEEVFLKPSGAGSRRSGSKDETITLGQSKSGQDSRGLTTVGLVMGTLGYMSPEQASGEDVTSFSDMYSFGILLEELFSGKSSFNKELSFDSLLEKNRNNERERITVEDADVAALISDLTVFEPQARLTAREAGQRIAFILERPLRKRKRILVTSVISVLTIFALIATIFWIRALKAEKRAREEAEAAKQVSDFLAGLFEVSDPSEAKGNTITAKEVLDKGVEQIDKELEGQPKIQSQLMMTMGSVYSKIGLYKEARPLLEKSLALKEKNYGKDSIEAADILTELGILTEIEGKYKEAEALQRKVLEIRVKKFGELNRDVAVSLNNLAGVCVQQDKVEEAVGYYKKSLEIREKLSGPDHPDVALVINNIARIYSRQGNYAEAEKGYKRALDIWEKSYGHIHPDVAISLNNLAQIYKKQGKLAEAEASYKESLKIKEKLYGEDHPSLAATINNLAALYYSQNQFDKALSYWTRALEIVEKKFGSAHPGVALAYNNLALAYKAKHDYEKALGYYSKALAIFEKAYGEESTEVAMTTNNLGALHLALGNEKQAEMHYLKAVEIGRKKLGLVHPRTVNFELNLAELYFRQKKYASSEKIMADAWDDLQKTKESAAAEKVLVLQNLISLYENTGDKSKAEKYKAVLAANKAK
jgi:eukaryotic-like serine/threonine-protein kinase